MKQYIMKKIENTILSKDGTNEILVDYFKVDRKAHGDKSDLEKRKRKNESARTTVG